MFRRGTSARILCVVAFSMLSASLRLDCSSKKEGVQYGAGLIVNVPTTEEELANAVEDVAGNGIIRGSKEYEKDEYISGATEAADSRVFPPWTDGGKIFYKVRPHTLDPRNFKDVNDTGTLAVRYVVMQQDDSHTVLRIDAAFVEDSGHSVHPSNGSVESAEYKVIHDHIEAMELVKAQTAEAESKKRQHTVTNFLKYESQTSAPSSEEAPKGGMQNHESPRPPANVTWPATDSGLGSDSAESLEQQVHELRQKTERLVKAPGVPLKSAPFHSAANLQALPTGTEVLIVISTPYWYGVETHQGQHGWILRDNLEELP